MTEPAEGIVKRLLSWDEIEHLVQELVAKLPHDFDALLVITRGGMVPGGW